MVSKMDIVNLILLIVLIVVSIINIYIILKNKKVSNTDIEKPFSDLSARIEKISADMDRVSQNLRMELNSTISSTINILGDMIVKNQKQAGENQSDAISRLNTSISEKQDAELKAVLSSLSLLEERFKTFSVENEQKLENIRVSVEKRLSFIQEDNNKRLDEMRKVVDEKLQKTINDRMTQSFELVSQRLEQVYKGLGEMQSIASNVGDLKKVLSNVKTRGIIGEIQLGAILEEILSPEQYETNVETKKGSGKFVEFAIRLPGSDDGTVYLPIDSKFPGDTYSKLLDAYDTGNSELISDAVKVLKSTIKSEAKDIHDKYISPPDTTDFAILFLPFEGLYAEAVNRGLVEQLQREFKVNIAGPSTMAALLNSLQMGFKTLAVQKRSSEVWKILGAVKTEFDSFEKVLKAAQDKINKANDDLDKLVGVRTRQIKRKLRNVENLNEDLTQGLLDDETEE